LPSRDFQAEKQRESDNRQYDFSLVIIYHEKHEENLIFKWASE